MAEKLKLHDYQQVATDKIIETPRCALFLDMGLGKTASTLKAIDTLMNDYLEINRVLVVAPKRVAMTTWINEIEKWDCFNHITCACAIGTPKERVAAIESKSDILTINRENVDWLWKYYVAKKVPPPFDMIVIDESSSFKNKSTIRWKRMVAFTHFAKRVVLLSGTPSPNGLVDLWAQIYLLDNGQRLESTLTRFRSYYCYQPYPTINAWKVAKRYEKVISDKIKDICVSMKSEDYLKLPDRIDNIVKLKLDPKTMALSKKMENDLIIELDEEEITAANSAVVMNKLIQIASGAIYDAKGEYVEIHDDKLKALEEILEVNDDKPVMVFYNYRQEKERIYKYFAKLNPRELATPKDVKDWNEGKIRLLVVNPASVGHGLNLQAGGNIIVWFSLTWNLEYYEQANKRLHRQGQKETVIIHHLIASDTADEIVLARLKSKGEVQSDLLECIKAKIRETKTRTNGNQIKALPKGKADKEDDLSWLI